MKGKSIILSGIFIALLGCHTKNTSEPNKDQDPKGEIKSGKGIITETFVQIESDVIDKLNEDIISNSISNAADVIDFYKPKSEQTEGNYSYTSSSKRIDDQTYEYTVTETGLLDDSVEGIKSVILVKNENDIFKIISIKENYRCYRGHKDWSAERCM